MSLLQPQPGPEADKAEAVLEPATLPGHVAIIMDGNGRWAAQRGQPRLFGHKRGAEAVRTVTETAAELGVKVVTLYSFSTENWKRPADEVSGLMALLRIYLQNELKTLAKNNIRLRVLGDRSQLAPELTQLVTKVEQDTAKNDRMTLQLAIAYGARDDMVQAVRRIAQACQRGDFPPDAIDEAMIAANLATGDCPDPDLIIRTSGEQRLSNFLLWESAYSEFYFTPVLWPDFGRQDFVAALEAYAQRQRRFGGC